MAHVVEAIKRYRNFALSICLFSSFWVIRRFTTTSAENEVVSLLQFRKRSVLS